ncbi:MAG: hypothetical protein ACLQFM_17690 [Terriglobales bacterium]|jgi:quercetin dioxygenase-like cupin family protein
MKIYLRLAPALTLTLILTAFAAAQQAPVPVEDEPHHHVVLKNDSVIVMRVKVLPGESTEFHTHAHDRVAVELSEATITQQKPGEAEGATEVRKAGDVVASTANGPYTHRVHDVGSTAFEVLDVELLQRPTTASGPAAGKVEAENPSARVYKWTLEPGATAAMHSHDHPYLMIAATPMMLKMTGPDGKSMGHEVAAGDFHWIDGSVTHSLTNDGTVPGQIVEIELK